MLFSASAPGSLMILGEYSVLYGGKGIVCAINKRIRVTIIPRSDSMFVIHSDLGTLKHSYEHLKIQIPFEFILATLISQKKTEQIEFKKGCDIYIKAEFPSTLGLGSSAAVTVATLAALGKWLKKNWTHQQLLQQAKDIIIRIQGNGSGVDAAASIYGGLLMYEPCYDITQSLTPELPLTVVYSGKKIKTSDAILKMQEQQSEFPADQTDSIL